MVRPVARACAGERSVRSASLFVPDTAMTSPLGFGTGAAILFKGSGFYETDYRSKQYAAEKSKAEACPAPAASKTDKCDSCPKNTGSKNKE